MTDPLQNTPTTIPAPDAPSEETEKEGLAAAKEVVQALLKATKAQKLYLPNNPVRQKFVHELVEKFRVYLETYGSLSLKVRQYDLLYGTHPVYENTNRLESIAFRMYVDGLREISFHEGLAPEEIASFFEILAKDYDTGSPDDDIITLLWEKNFSHITYLVTKDFLGEETPVLEARSEPSETESGFREALRDARSIASSLAGQIESNPLMVHDRPDLQIFRLSEEEVARIRQEMESEENYHFVSELMDILFAILYIEEDYESFEQIVDILDDVLEVLVVNGDFQQASKILRLYREMLDPKKGLGPKHIERLSTGIDKAAVEGHLLDLQEHLEKKGLETAEHLYAFLVLLNKNAIVPLTNLLGSFKHMEIRRVLCEALVGLAKNDVALLGARVNDNRWFIVRNIALILGRIGGPEALSFLEKIINHPEVKVRKEVFRAISGIDGEKSAAAILRFLKDPDHSLRIDAVRHLAAHHYPPAESSLLDLINEKDFEERELMEKKEVFDALARIGGDRIVPALRKFVRKRVWFWQKKSRLDEMGVCAAFALKTIGSPAAIEVLKEGQKVSSKVVKETCRRVFEELTGGIAPTPEGKS